MKSRMRKFLITVLENFIFSVAIGAGLVVGIEAVVTLLELYKFFN